MKADAITPKGDSTGLPAGERADIEIGADGSPVLDVVTGLAGAFTLPPRFLAPCVPAECRRRDTGTNRSGSHAA